MADPRDVDTFRLDALDARDESEAGSSRVASSSVASSSVASGSVASGSAEAGRYVFVGTALGRGGVGRVDVARDTRLGRDVALKRPVGGTRGVDALREEARVTAALAHPNIVPVYDAGEDGEGIPWYTMPIVRGRTLAEAVVGTTFEARIALVPHVHDLCQALAYAHAQGVLHRDLKPANVMIGAFGETIVLDWGLGSAAPSAGTPGYLAPEQAAGLGAQLGERTDVWGAGAVLYAVLTGEAPYPGPAAEALVATLRGPPEAVERRAPQTPPELAAITTRALAFDPADRYPSAAAMAADLTAYMTGQRVDAHRYGAWELILRWVGRHRAVVRVIAASGLVITGLLAWTLSRTLVERDRALADAQARALEVAAGLTREAADALTLGDAARARSAITTAVGIQADPVARGLRIRAESAWIPPAPVVTRSGGTACPALAWSRDGVLAAACTEVLWRAPPTGEPESLLSGDHTLASVAWVGDVLVAADRTGAVWRASAGEPRQIAQGEGPLDLFPGPDGSVLVSTRDGGVEVWTLDGARRPLLGPEKGWRRPALSPDGARIAVAATDGIRLLDADRGIETRKLPGVGSDTLNLAWNPDGRWIASGGALRGGTRRVTVWDVETGAAEALREHGGMVTDLAYSPDGRWLAAACADEGVRLWEAGSWAYLGLLSTPPGRTGGVAFSPDGQSLAATVGGEIVRWRLDPPPRGSLLRTGEGRVVGFTDSWAGSADPAASLGMPQVIDDRGAVYAFDPTGQGAIVASVPPGARGASIEREGAGVLLIGDGAASGVWSPEPGSWVPLATDVTLRRGAWLGDGHVVATDGAAVVTFASDSGRPVGPPCPLRGGPHYLDARDGLVVAATRGALVSLRPLTCATIAVLDTVDPTNFVQISPDGTRLAAIARSGRVTLHGFPGLEPLGTLASHTQPVAALTWAADGARLAVGDGEGMVEVWDVAAATLLARWAAHDQPVAALRFTPMGDRLYTASWDGTMGVWNLAGLSAP